MVINGCAGRTLRRLQKDIMPCPLRSPGTIQYDGRTPVRIAGSRQRQTGQRGRQFAGITHGCRAEDEGRVGSVAGRQTRQTAEYPRHVRAENAAVHVRFVNDNMRKARQKGGPLFMMRQNAKMEHFGIADQDRGRLTTNLAPGIVRRIAVIQRNGRTRLFRPGLRQRLKGQRLILRQRLERKEVQRPGIRIAQKVRQYGQTVDQALAAGCGRCHNNAAAAPDKIRRCGLMAVEAPAPLLKTAPAQRLFHGLRPRQTALAVLSLFFRQAAMMPHLPAQTLRGQQRPHIFPDIPLL